jgi:hypothetical protein
LFLSFSLSSQGLAIIANYNSALTDQAALRRLEELRREINYHNYRYHVLDDPVVSDYEFDQLLLELRRIETDHPEWITPDSPTQRAGAIPTEKFAKVRHPRPILSLGNAFDADDVRAWYERILGLDSRVRKADFVIEPRSMVDSGLTLSTVSLFRRHAATQCGEDIRAICVRSARCPANSVSANAPVAPKPGGASRSLHDVS